MSAIFSSTIQVLHPGGNELVVHFPVQHTLSVLFGILAGVFTLFFGMLIKSNGFRASSLALLPGFLPAILFLYIVTQSSSITFSRIDNNVVIQEHLFFRTQTMSYPLQSVDHAEVALDDGHSHTFYLALNSGQRIPVGGGWTPRRGYYEAADAVNQFMPPSHATSTGDAVHPSSSSFEEKRKQAEKAFLDGARDAPKTK
jgi:hypothetical protein